MTNTKILMMISMNQKYAIVQYVRVNMLFSRLAMCAVDDGYASRLQALSTL